MCRRGWPASAHEIPEAKIRERYPKSLANLVSFIGAAAEVHVFDNSAESADGLPQTLRVFRMRGERIIEPDLETLMTQTPNWAKPIVAAAVKVHTRRDERREGRNSNPTDMGITCFGRRQIKFERL